MIRGFTKLLKSPSIGVLAVFTGGNLVVALLGGVGGLLQAHFVSPEVFGAFRKYGILTAYFAIGTALVHDGFCRQFPYCLGAGKKEKALKVASVAKAWYLFVTVLFSAVFAVLAAVALVKGDRMDALGWLTQVAVVVGTIYGAYLVVLYRTSSDFKQLAYNSVWSAVIAFLLLVPVKLFGFVGLAIRTIGSNLYAVWINARHLPVKVRASFDWCELKPLMAMSLRLSIPGYLDTSVLSATFNAVLLFSCGDKGVGIFAFALALREFILIFNISLSQIFNVKLCLRYGATKDFCGCVRYALLPTLGALVVSCALYMGAVCFTGPFIRHCLPRYEEAIPVLSVLYLGIITNSFFLPLKLTRAAAMYSAVYAQCVGEISTAIVLLLVMKHDPVSMAWILVLSGFGNCLGGYVFIARRYCQLREECKHIEGVNK